ncbi:MAG: 2TM domain-containing protein [Cyclobacteriaceae bacterium]|nr:2TM domain-containing protein [Cyclobacteriaceae bacterium]
METSEEQLYREARKRVKRKKEFYQHVLSYFIISSGLTLLNWLQHSRWWVQWVWIGWGLGILLHALSFFGITLFDDQWETREIQKEIKRLKPK